ncbi:ankyrin repeat-containing domain protein [Coprinopsis sp. MPI-PUGE-AT-0042]|nr:ankyrin repeat-containing domain protein [Coprinopsis sp. MPI-PUGE-AT-0042]
MSRQKNAFNFTRPPQWTVAADSGLIVTDEMRKIMAKPGFLDSKPGGPGDRFRYLYSNHSMGFTQRELSPFAQACVAGLLDFLRQAFEDGDAPDLTTTETAYEQGYAAYIVLGAQRLTPRFPGMKTQWTESLEFLISKGLPLNLADIGGYTALHHLVLQPAQEKATLLKTLLAHGADVNQQNRWGEPPLMVAMAQDDLTSIETLLEHRADVNIKDGNGHSALTTYTACGSRVSALFDKWIKKQAGENAPLSEPNRCDSCRIEGKGFKKCARCKTAQYCSKECQTTAWKAHKPLCKPFNNTSTVTVRPFYRPGASTIPSDALIRGAMAGLPTRDVPQSHMRGSHIPRDLTSAGKKMVLKVQVPTSRSSLGDLLVYTKKRDLVCQVRRIDGEGAYDELVRTVRTQGVAGAKGYFVADLRSRDELVIKTSEILSAQPW